MIRLPRIVEMLFSCADAIARCCPCTRDDLFETGTEAGSWSRPNSVTHAPNAPLPMLTPPRRESDGTP